MASTGTGYLRMPPISQSNGAKRMPANITASTNSATTSLFSRQKPIKRPTAERCSGVWGEVLGVGCWVLGDRWQVSGGRCEVSGGWGLLLPFPFCLSSFIVSILQNVFQYYP